MKTQLENEINNSVENESINILMINTILYKLEAINCYR